MSATSNLLLRSPIVILLGFGLCSVSILLGLSRRYWPKQWERKAIRVAQYCCGFAMSEILGASLVAHSWLASPWYTRVAGLLLWGLGLMGAMGSTFLLFLVLEIKRRD